MIRLFMIIMVFVSCSGSSVQEIKKQAISFESIVYEVQSEPILEGIQAKILQAFAQCLVSKNPTEINALETKLLKLSKTESNKLITYWLAYLKFYKSVYYMVSEDKKNAEKTVDKGIGLLEGIKGKNAEDFALLVMLQGFSIQFKAGIRAPFISKELGKNIAYALALDSENIRVYYVMANNDFYTPEKYGGGSKVEEYALKAISLPDQKTKNNYLPSWGKEEAYELLIKHYIKKENWKLATKYYKEATGIFPNSYQISKLAGQLVGK